MLSPFLVPVLAILSVVVSLIVVAPIGALIDLVLREDDPDDFGSESRPLNAGSKSFVSQPEPLDADDDLHEYKVDLDDELIEGETETFAEKERRLIAEMDALETLARASRPWTGASALADQKPGNSAMVEKAVMLRLSLQGVGSALAKIVTTISESEAKDPTTLWGAICRAQARIGPAACHFELTALRMAAVQTAIEDLIADGFAFSDEVRDAYEEGLLAVFRVLPYAKQLIASGHAEDPDGLLSLGYARQRIYVDAARESAVERQARMLVEFEARCLVEPGTFGLAVPYEFDLLREFAGKMLRGALQADQEQR